MSKVCNEGIAMYLEGIWMYINPLNSFCFFDKFLQFMTYLEESISLPKKVWELEEVTVGSSSYLVEYQPPKITAPHSIGSRRL
jgi:hypothetical protein